MGRYLALDIGRKKTGVAVTDTSRIIATALETVPSGELEKFLTDYISKNDVEKIIYGQPTQMDNSPSESMQYITPILNRLKKVFPNLTFIPVDERFTSKLAFQAMIDGGTTKKQRRDKTMVDKISATIILQSYMEQEKFSKL